MEDLPSIPSTLRDLHCELPMHEDEICSGHIVFRGMDPDRVGWINHVFHQTMVQMNRKSKERCMKRCKEYKEQIMIKVWRPSRVQMLLEMGYDHEDM